MATLAPQDILDLANFTLGTLDRGRWQDLTANIQEYLVLPMLLNENSVVERGGDQVDFNLQTARNDNARFVGMYEPDSTNIQSLGTTGFAPWSIMTGSWGFDEKESVFNRGAAEIVNYIEMRRRSAYAEIGQLLEDTFWGKPASSADTKTMLGLQYSVVYAASNNGTFTTNLPTGFTTVYGITPSTANNYTNYTITHDGGFGSNRPSTGAAGSVVESIRKAMRYTDFKAIPQAASPAEQPIRRVIYTTEGGLAGLEIALKAGNENIGSDLVYRMGTAMFRNVPVVWAPKLEQIATPANMPFYGIDWGTLKFHVQSDWNMRASPLLRSAQSHNVFTQHIDFIGQLVNENRRKHFVASAGDPSF